MANNVHDKSTISKSAITLNIAERVVRTHYDTLNDNTRLLAKQCILDCIGVTLRAREEPLVQTLLKVTDAAQHSGPSMIIGHDISTTPQLAALINGAASHALDYDDVNIYLDGHPTVVVLPAALALAEYLQVSGQALISAFAAGYDVACRVGYFVHPTHYAKGFHVTGTAGAFASAAACANLLGLDVAQTRIALGIAATQAAGLKSMFGTMCKPFHAGKANQNGLIAAQLAAAGFTSILDGIEAAQGFAQTHADSVDLTALTLPDYPLNKNLFKYHASCYQTHAPLNAITDLMEEYHFSPSDVARIHLTHAPIADSVCNISRPSTGLEIKFSLAMLMALALYGIDTAKPESFIDQHCSNPDLVATRDKVVVKFDDTYSITQSTVEVHLHSGRVLTKMADSGIPESDLASQTAKLQKKFYAINQDTINKTQLDAIVAATLHLDEEKNMSNFPHLVK